AAYEVAEDQEQGQDRHRAQCHHHSGHQSAERPAARSRGHHIALLPMAAPFATRHTSRRAIALMMTVITNSRKPTSKRAERYMVVVASLNSLAMAAAIVKPGCSTETLMSCRLPISMVTAMVSPSARPRPSMIAPMMPARPYGRTADHTASQRVAPSPSAASRWLPGTARSTSRDTAAIYGT